MFRLRILLGTFVIVSGMILVGPASATEIAWVPVSADGAHTIEGNTIFLESGGQVVTLHGRVSNWDPDGDGHPTLGTYQIGLDSTGFSSGAGDPLTPLAYPTPKHGAYQVLRTCQEYDGVNFISCGEPCDLFGPGDPGCPGGAAAGCMFCEPNPDFVFAGHESLAAVCTVWPHYAWGATVWDFNCKADEGGTYYAATLEVVVPGGAEGNYTIAFDDASSQTFLNNCGGSPISDFVLTPARIVIACSSDSDCDDGKECTTDDVCDQGICTYLSAPAGTGCGDPTDTDCDNPDACDGMGNCLDNFMSSTTICRPAVGDCDIAEYCTGSDPACPPDGFASPGSACNDGNGAGICFGSRCQPKNDQPPRPHHWWFHPESVGGGAVDVSGVFSADDVHSAAGNTGDYGPLSAPPNAGPHN